MYFIDTPQMLYLSAIIVSVSVTAFFTRKRKLQKTNNEKKKNLFQLIDTILANLIYENSPVELMLISNYSEVYISTCILTNFDKSKITFRIISNCLEQDYIFKKIHCYFSIIKDKKKVFYDFFATIENLYKHENEYYITINRPERISNNQKRRFVRFEPPASTFSTIQLWAVLPKEKTNTDTMPQSFSLHAISAHSITVNNISAGGLLLKVKADAPIIANLLQTHFFVLRVVMAAEADANLAMPELRTVSKICRITRVDSTSSLFGLEFLRWFQPGENSDTSHWLEVLPEEGIPSLAADIMRMERIQRLKHVAIKPLETLPELLNNAIITKQ